MHSLTHTCSHSLTHTHTHIHAQLYSPYSHTHNFHTYASPGYGGKDKGGESAIADKWFEGQKKFYVDMGKTLGDTVREK